MTIADAVIAAARSQIGKPYVWGAEDPNVGFDCSALVQWSFAQAGVRVPRTSQQQAAGGIPVALNDLQPADVITFYTDASHAALYSGNGNIIQASRPGVPIAEVPLAQGGPIHNARQYIQEPTTMSLFGVDVSNNNWSSAQECQDFIASLPGQGYSWVEAKVSEGNYYSDPYWAATREACQSAGVPVIGYHYANAASSPESQVSTFAANGGGDSVMIDFEANSGNINDFWALVNAFNGAGITVRLSYLPRWYWQEIGSPDLTGIPGLISSSYYGSGDYGSTLYANAGGDSGNGWNAYGNASPVIWQFTDGALVNGKSVDANAFLGSVADLQTLLGITTGGPFMALTDDEQQEVLDGIRYLTAQLGPNIWGPASSFGTNAQGQELTMRDGLCQLKRDVEAAPAASTHVTNVFTAPAAEKSVEVADKEGS